MRDRVIVLVAALAIATGGVLAAIGFQRELSRPIPQWIEPHLTPATPLLPGGPIR